MKCTNLILPAATRFLDGSIVRITYACPLAAVGVPCAPCGKARLEFANGHAVELQGVVDDGETADAPSVFVVSGNPPRTLMFLGGTHIYNVDSLGAVEGCVQLPRSLGDSEYWKTEIIETGLGLVFVFESVVILIDQELRVVWEREKRFNDFFDGFDKNRLLFCADHQHPWYLELSSGNPEH